MVAGPVAGPSAEVVAGISFSGPVMRYAEIEHERQGSTLRRLGSCRFDFEVSDCLTRAESADDSHTLAEAVGQIFAGSSVRLLSVALDPRLCFQFATAIDSRADEGALTRQVLKELTLVADDENPLFVSTESLDTRSISGGSVVSWVQVMALPEATRARLRGLADVLGATLHVSTTLRAASSIVACLDGPGVAREPAHSLLLGEFDEYTEFAVCTGGRRRVSGLAIPQDRADAAHALWSFVRRLGLAPRDLRTVYLYGDSADGALADVSSRFGATIRRLGPLDGATLQADSGSANLDAYVSCVGAALEPAA